jgi:hypothetical protein
MKHELIDGTLFIEKQGIIGRCICGWSTGHRFSLTAASAAFQDHKDQTLNTSGSGEKDGSKDTK